MRELNELELALIAGGSNDTGASGSAEVEDATNLDGMEIVGAEEAEPTYVPGWQDTSDGNTGGGTWHVDPAHNFSSTATQSGNTLKTTQTWVKDGSYSLQTTEVYHTDTHTMEYMLSGSYVDPSGNTLTINTTDSDHNLGVGADFMFNIDNNITLDLNATSNGGVISGQAQVHVRF